MNHGTVVRWPGGSGRPGVRALLGRTVLSVARYPLSAVEGRSIFQPAVESRGRRVRQRVEPHVLPQEVFRHLLSRERSRAERLGEPFTLVLMPLLASAERLPSVLSSRAAIEAVAAAVGEVSVVGWHVQNDVLGVIWRDVVRAGAPDTLIRHALRARLDVESAAAFSIQSHRYDPGSAAPEVTTAGPAPDSRARPRPVAGYRLKRPLDVCGSLALLILLAPVCLLISALMKATSRGPILFRQRRVGQMARPFTMLKFRTMRPDADPALHHQFVTTFIKSNPSSGHVGNGLLYKLTHDPRVTPIGRLLRKTSLDEVPQLWNVLMGDMSLVGPRPPIPYEVEAYSQWHRRRVLDAKPGLTGLWQVKGRSTTTFDEMVRLDLQYVRTCSLWTDLKILLATPRAVVSGKGAA